MWLKLTAGDLTVDLQIKDYQPGTADVDLAWCHVDLKLDQEPWLHYERLDGETLSSWELDQLNIQLDHLLSGEVDAPTRLELIQNDYTFRMNPKVNLEKLSLDWNLHLEEEGVHQVSFTLSETEVQYLWIYLNYCTGALPENQEAVVTLLDSGIFHR